MRKRFSGSSALELKKAYDRQTESDDDRRAGEQR